MEENRTLEELTSIYVNSETQSIKDLNFTFDYGFNYIDVFEDLRTLVEETDVSFNIATVNSLIFFRTFLNGVLSENKYLLSHEVLEPEVKVELSEELEVLEKLLDSITAITGVISVHADGMKTIATEKLERSIVSGRELNNTFEGLDIEEDFIGFSKDGLIKFEVIVTEESTEGAVESESL